MKINKLKFIVLLFFCTIVSINSANGYNNKAVDYLNAGNLYYKNGQIDKAIISYRKAISIDPKGKLVKHNLCVIYYNQGLNYFNKNQYEQAIRCFEQALTLDPDYTNAKYNLFVSYNNLGLKSYHKGYSDQAIQYYKKALNFNSQADKTYYNLGVIYSSIAEYELAVQNYEKAAQLQPNEEEYWYALAKSYMNTKNYKLAKQCYAEVLRLNPSNQDAQYYLQAIKQRQEDIAKEAETNDSISKLNSIKAAQKAPRSVYDLVTWDTGVGYSLVTKCQEILDLIWSDPDGNKLLTTLVNKKIPIHIAQAGKAYAKVEGKDYKAGILLWGILPLTFNVKSVRDISVNINVDYISSFYNSNLDLEYRLYSLMVFGHEFSHAAKITFSKKYDNALEEELAVTMIGYNIASRIVNGRELNRDETSYYSKKSLRALLTDEHRSLPIYNNYIAQIQKYGINPPNPDIYRNLLGVYMAIRNDPQTQKLDTFEKLIK